MCEYSKYLVITECKYGGREIHDDYDDEAEAVECAQRLGEDGADDYETIIVYKATSVGTRAGFAFTKVK